MVAFMRIQQANIGYGKRVIMDDAAKNLQKSENFSNLNNSPFRHLGKTHYDRGQGVKRSPFKNFK